MFSQSSLYPDTISSSSVLKSSVGTGLAGGSPNLAPNDGALAIDDSSKKLYYGATNVWTPIGDVVGPASSTDNAVARFDGTTGKVIQNSSVIISDAGAITGITTLNGNAVATGTNTGDVTLAAFGSTPNANGASLSGQVLTLQPASVTQPGGVSIAAQTFNGVKTFDDGVIVSPTVTSGVENLFYQAYHHNIGSTNFTGAGAISCSVLVQRTEAFGFIAFGTSNSLVGGGGILTIATPLVVEFRPGTARSAMVNIINNGSYALGACRIATDGTVTIGKAFGAGSALVGFDAGTMQILDSAFCYVMA